MTDFFPSRTTAQPPASGNKLTRTQEPIPGWKTPEVDPQVDVPFDTQRQKALEYLEKAYQVASKNAADPRIQSTFREAFYAYRLKYFDANLQPIVPVVETKGAKA